MLSFFTGGHEDYNRPTDDPEKLNYDGIERISDLAYGIVLDLIGDVERPEYVRVERSQSEEGSRDTLRAYLGYYPRLYNRRHRCQTLRCSCRWSRR